MWTGGWTQEKRRTRERIVHGNEKDLGARRGYGVALHADLSFHDAASDNKASGMDFLLYYHITTRCCFDDKANEEFSFSAREFFIISLVRRRLKMLECNRIP